MYNFLKEYQLDIMLFMAGICFVLILLTIVTKTLSKKRRRILALMETAAMFLLLFDRIAYIYRGVLGNKAYWMVTVSNFMVYFLTLIILHQTTLYLMDLYRNEGKLKVLPKRLMVCEILFAFGVIMLVISQFTGMYYTIDANNTYQRGPLFTLCYIAPLLIILIQLSVIIQYRNSLRKLIFISLLLITTVPLVASIAQIFAYGLSLVNMTIVGNVLLLYVFALIDMNKEVKQARNLEIELLKNEQKREHALFEQTAEALANAIDAKDQYTHGHSSRVAIYSQQIAKYAGWPEAECEKVYFAALLHDVGKIGVSDAIINKEGKLTDEEYAEIKKHPVYGNQILSSIQESPYLSIGAHFHHERYDGRGYPDNLKAEDIPEIARIIAVADAYDAMTSKRSYRDTIPQQKAREEIVKGMGTQFDPQYAKIMLHLIDMDTEYSMKEHKGDSDDVLKTKLICDHVYDESTIGLLLSDHITRISLYAKADEGSDPLTSIPSAIIFDSLDGRAYEDEIRRKDLLYYEYALVRFDGHIKDDGVRKSQLKTYKRENDDEEFSHYKNFTRYEIEACRIKDHLQVKIMNKDEVKEVTLALPDNSRFAFLAISGDHCLVSNIKVRQDDEGVSKDHIERIAEEISFIKDKPQGDIPNVEVDGWKTEYSEGIKITDGMKIRFHGQSLPTGRLIWHCPYISVYTSKNNKPDGPDFIEYVLIRLDGENWESDEHAKNEVIIEKTNDFEGWNSWKDKLKEGIDCEVSIFREGNKITVMTENLGIAIKSITMINDDVDDIYLAFTGDQCTISDVHIIR